MLVAFGSDLYLALTACHDGPTMLPVALWQARQFFCWANWAGAGRGIVG